MPTPITASQSTVASSATPVLILAANSARRGASIANASTAVLYLLLGASTNVVSAVNFSVAIPPSTGYFEVPFGFTGQIMGVWAAVNGTAQLTEYVM